MENEIQNMLSATDFESIEYLQEKSDIEGDFNDDIVDILKNEVISYMGNYSLSEYANRLGKEFIKPQFQRNEVWDTKAKSKLIESFLASYPVPSVFYIRKKGKKHIL